jgi:hypothetical protein
MEPGEYAVHYSCFVERATSSEPYCTVFANLTDAVAYAQEQVAIQPKLRCTIYDHEGFGKPAIKDVRGTEFREQDGFSPRFRRWVGSILFFGGVILTGIDWYKDFALSWPAMIGTRIVLPGLALLAVEAVIVIEARRKRSDEAVIEPPRNGKYRQKRNSNGY